MEVRLIDENGEYLGNIPIQEALRMARDKYYDLVEISPKATPPVAKFLKFGQFKYDLKKKEQQQKAKQKKTEVKGVRLSFRIGKGDLELKSNQTKKFLEEGHKVKIEMLLKGRERSHADLAKKIIERFIQNITEAKIEQPLSKLEGKLIVLIAKK